MLGNLAQSSLVHGGVLGVLEHCPARLVRLLYRVCVKQRVDLNNMLFKDNINDLIKWLACTKNDSAKVEQFNSSR